MFLIPVSEERYVLRSHGCGVSVVTDITSTYRKATLPGCRPKAVRLVSGVGSEEVEFEPAVPLEGKVEIYMQVFQRDLQVLFSTCEIAVETR